MEYKYLISFIAGRPQGMSSHHRTIARIAELESEDIDALCLQLLDHLKGQSERGDKPTTIVITSIYRFPTKRAGGAS